MKLKKRQRLSHPDDYRGRSYLNREWAKLAKHAKRYGQDSAVSRYLEKYVVGGLCPKTISLALGLKLADLLMKVENYSVAGNILKELKFRRIAHPLLDELYSSFLWCIGKKRQALVFVLSRARFWNRSYLYAQAGAFYRLNDNEKMAEKYFNLAESRADLELKRDKNIKPVFLTALKRTRVRA